MYNHIERLDILKRNSNGYWAERILFQLQYAVKLSMVNNGVYDKLIGKIVRFLDEKYVEEGAITKMAARQAEDMIQEISDAAKNFKIICAAHAHIDMNWMWGYAETASVAIDTFRTILNLMKEYPDFVFSQSQASVYRIVEEYDPDMLEEIKERVEEGRWEVTASTWVEADKNMPNGESFARHILYTKKYLSKLLNLNPDSLQLDFEPDTFGHSQNVPEILSKGGVKYYYHCRGYDGHNIYRWKAPSGSSVLVYREPLGYNASIEADIALMVPEFYIRHGMNTMLKVYGVGDHGGGPTRRDVEKLIEMNSWPVFPTIKFGTFAEYFGELDRVAEKLPVVEGELNFVFTGCYTTQTRIKTANRIAETKLHDAEAYSALSTAFANGKYPGEVYEKAWRKVLFNQFHDILPGSGVIETREHAMGQFQEVLAAANTGLSKAMRNIASQINTASLTEAEEDTEDIKDTISEGAGVGFSISDYGTPQTERGHGKNRIIHFFNPSSHERNEPVEITVWDWPGDIERIEITDVDGRAVRHQVVSGKAQQLHPAGVFWGHKYTKLLVDVSVPAYGYNTYLLKEKNLEDYEPEIPSYPRVETPDEYILENEYVKVQFDTSDASITSLIDKSSGNELVDPNRPTGIFRLIEEDDSKGMTAWCIGRYINIYDLNRDIKVKQVSLNKDRLRQWITYGILFRSSRLDVTVSLDYDSSRLDFSVECDWQETAEIDKFVPQLNFYMPLIYKCRAYKYDIPFGTIVREAMNMDVPANSWALAIPEKEGDKAVMAITNSKYGFRSVDDSISITLIRSSYEPDPYPDNGIHSFKFAVELVNYTDDAVLIQRAFDYNHPIGFISGLKHEGNLPMTNSFISLEGGSVIVSAIKMPETDGDNRLIIRVYETTGSKTQAIFRIGAKVSKAWFVDLNERIMDNAGIYLEEDSVKFNVEANSIANICIEFL